MKKIFNILLIAATFLGIASSCSDVPMPYDINKGESSFGKKLPYKNASLSTFSTYNLKDYAAWSQGSSYTQATGYQAWDGASTKSNKEVESYLISPAINTTCASGQVRISFDETIRYTNNVTGWKDYHRIYMSKDYDGIPNNFNEATWTEIDFVAVESPYSDWTLYSSNYIKVPDEFVNCDSVYVAFYFYAPESASTTWELENFLIEEGDASESSDTPSGEEVPEGEGTADSPYNISALLTYCQSLQPGDSSPNQIYFKGIVSSIKEISASYGNATFYLSDDGTANNTFYVYRALGLGNTNVTDENFIHVGDTVVVCGTVTNYNGTYETAQKAAYVVSVNGGSGSDTPSGQGEGDGKTAETAMNVAKAIAYTSALAADTNSDEVYITGIVCSDPSIDTGSYGNATFYISDDGTDATKFYVFRTFDIDGAKFTDANKVKKGDKVVIYGPLVNYKGNTPETVASKTHLVSINGSSEGGSEEGGSDTPSGTSEGISIDGTTVTLTNSAVTAGSETITIDLSTLGYENAAEMGTVTLSDGTTIVFEAGTNSNAPKYYTGTKGARVYANNIITFNGKSTIAKIEMSCDSYNGTDYVGNTTATIAVNGKQIVYTNASADAGTQLRVKTITITYAASSAKKRAVRR